MAAKQYSSPCILLLTLVFFSLLLVNVNPTSAFPSNKMKSQSVIIKEVNRNGPYIGLVTVYAPEENAFFSTSAFMPHKKHPFVDLSGRRYRVGKVVGKKVIYVRCGIGLVNAAAATQQMVDVFKVKGIVHFGIAGNANNSMSIGDVTVPKQFAHTGLWDWLNPNGTVPSNDVGEMDFGDYNVPKGEGMNKMGQIGYSKEQFYSESGKPNVAAPLFWANVTHQWLHLAASLEGMELERCVNSSVCLEKPPKVVVGLKGSTANMFIDNAAYRNFLHQTFGVSSVDMESSAVVMTSLSNEVEVIVMRGLSDLAGKQDGENAIHTFGSLAAINVAKAVVSFLTSLPISSKFVNDGVIL